MSNFAVAQPLLSWYKCLVTRIGGHTENFSVAVASAEEESFAVFATSAAVTSTTTRGSAATARTGLRRERANTRWRREIVIDILLPNRPIGTRLVRCARRNAPRPNS